MFEKSNYPYKMKTRFRSSKKIGKKGKRKSIIS